MSNCIDILARDVVAFHFCQLDDEPTCTVPEFVHNLAAQMSRSPHLLSFRTLLQQSPELLSLLSYHSCLENPSKALIKGILEPLTLLRSQGKISGQRCLILIGKYLHIHNTPAENVKILFYSKMTQFYFQIHYVMQNTIEQIPEKH